MSKINIELDEKLVAEALKLTGLKTINAVVHFALQELVRKKRRKKLLEFAGRVQWAGDLYRTRKSRI